MSGSDIPWTEEENNVLISVLSRDKDGNLRQKQQWADICAAMKLKMKSTTAIREYTPKNLQRQYKVIKSRLRPGNTSLDPEEATAKEVKMNWTKAEDDQLISLLRRDRHGNFDAVQDWPEICEKMNAASSVRVYKPINTSGHFHGILKNRADATERYLVAQAPEQSFVAQEIDEQALTAEEIEARQRVSINSLIG